MAAVAGLHHTTRPSAAEVTLASMRASAGGAVSASLLGYGGAVKVGALWFRLVFRFPPGVSVVWAPPCSPTAVVMSCSPGSRPGGGGGGGDTKHAWNKGRGGGGLGGDVDSAPRVAKPSSCPRFGQPSRMPHSLGPQSCCLQAPRTAVARTGLSDSPPPPPTWIAAAWTFRFTGVE